MLFNIITSILPVYIFLLGIVILANLDPDLKCNMYEDQFFCDKALWLVYVIWIIKWLFVISIFIIPEILLIPILGRVTIEERHAAMHFFQTMVVPLMAEYNRPNFLNSLTIFYYELQINAGSVVFFYSIFAERFDEALKMNRLHYSFAEVFYMLHGVILNDTIVGERFLSIPLGDNYIFSLAYRIFALETLLYISDIDLPQDFNSVGYIRLLQQYMILASIFSRGVVMLFVIHLLIPVNVLWRVLRYLRLRKIRWLF